MIKIIGSVLENLIHRFNSVRSVYLTWIFSSFCETCAQHIVRYSSSWVLRSSAFSVAEDRYRNLLKFTSQWSSFTCSPPSGNDTIFSGECLCWNVITLVEIVSRKYTIESNTHWTPVSKRASMFLRILSRRLPSSELCRCCNCTLSIHRV